MSRTRALALATGLMLGISTLPAVTFAAQSASAAPLVHHTVTKSAKAVAAIPSGVTNGPGISVPAGPHLKALGSHLWLGQYLNAGVISYCVQSDKPLTSGQTLSGASNIPGVSTAASQKVAWVLSNWGSSSSASQAAAVAAAVKYLADPRVKPDWAWYKHVIPASIYKSANTMIARANAYYGPHSLTVSVGKSGLVGQHVNVSVVVRSKATGHVVPNVPINVLVTGAQPVGTAPATTGASGTARFVVAANNLSSVKVHVTIAVQQSVMLMVTSPSNQQELVSWYPSPENLVAAKAWKVKRPAPPQVSQNCTTSCNGVAPVTISDCNAVGSSGFQDYVYDNGVYRGRLTLGSGKCASLTIQVADTHHVTTKYRYLVNGKWTALTRESTNFVVDCPPLPAVSISAYCDCNGSPSITISLPANNSPHTQMALVGSTVVVATKPGDAAQTVKIGLTPNSPIVISAGAMRADGSLRTKPVFQLSAL